MTIKALLETKLFDEYEQVVILTGGVNIPHILYKGYISEMPEGIDDLKIESIGSMGEHRRKQFHLNHYGWTEIWV